MELAAYRCAAWETPFWFELNPGAGRYNGAGEAPTTYLGLHPLTPWAEYLRAYGLRGDDVLAARPPTWAMRIHLEEDEVVELSFDEPGPLSAADLVDDDCTACRAFARALRSDPNGPKAIIAPSAALPGTRNLVLLAPRVIAPYLPDPIDPAIDSPAAITAVRGRAPVNLAGLVHYRGTGARHPGLEAWESGDHLELTEPALETDEISAAIAGP